MITIIFLAMGVVMLIEVLWIIFGGPSSWKWLK